MLLYATFWFKMNLQFCWLLSFASILCLFQVIENASSNEALIECAKVHHLDIHQFPTSSQTEYSNSKCALVCAIGNDTLPVEPVNQGKFCPEDTSGICHNGQCIGGMEDALRMCTVEHSLDFSKIKDHQGTAFTNAQCMLRCVLSGKEWSVNYMHEGSPCPANPNGVCRSGTCVTQSTNPTETTFTKQPATIAPPTISTLPTTVTKPSIGPFSASKLTFLNISIVTVTPKLEHDQSVAVLYYPKKFSYISTLCTLYSNLTQSCSASKISDIKNSLAVGDQLEVRFVDGHYFNETQNDLYAIISGYYQWHRLNLGGKEIYQHGYSINTPITHKPIDIELHFTVVFNKD